MISISSLQSVLNDTLYSFSNFEVIESTNITYASNLGQASLSENGRFTSALSPLTRLRVLITWHKTKSDLE